MRDTLRGLGIRMGRLPTGDGNCITDVPGVRVGHATRIEGQGPLRVGKGPVRTGVTVVVPPGDGPWRAASDVINGYGKTLGLIQVEELGLLESPIFLTNTLGVGAVQQGYLAVVRDQGRYDAGRSQNVVIAECNDGRLNDLWGLHVRPEDAAAALSDAQACVLAVQGSIGAGTGMTAFGYKGGVGSASRRLTSGAVLGALVLANCGRAEELRLDGLAVPSGMGEAQADPPPGSIIIVLATDADLDDRALSRACRRAVHGLARTGAISAPGSGDIALFFTTAQAAAPDLEEVFLAVAEATEEAIWNALCTAETMVGRDDQVSRAISHETLRKVWAGRAAP